MSAGSTKGERGTIQYKAPELFKPPHMGGPVYLKAADVYSFGILSWELFSGEKAFLNKPGVKEQVEADIKWQTQKVLIELGDYTCMQRGEAIEKNARFGHGAIDI